MGDGTPQKSIPRLCRGLLAPIEGPNQACPAPSRGTLSGAPQISGRGAVSSAGPRIFSENLVGVQVDSSSPYMNIMVMENFSEEQNR